MKANENFNKNLQSLQGDVINIRDQSKKLDSLLRDHKDQKLNAIIVLEQAQESQSQMEKDLAILRKKNQDL